jgi:hypothetical protein
MEIPDNERNRSYAHVAYQPDAAYVPLFSDPEDTCLSYNEHAFACGIT